MNHSQPHLRLVSGTSRSARPHLKTRYPSPNKVQLALEEVALLMSEVVDECIVDPLRTMVTEHLQTGGKRIRSRTALEAAAALGMDPQAVIEIAAACEFLHNATLVHDDLQDGDTVRRGAPTVWVRHGKAQAINVGDVMLMMSTLVLRESAFDAATRWWLSEALSSRAVATAAGQSLELALLQNEWVDRERYLKAASGKSGPFFALPIEAAALCAGLDPELAHSIGDATLGLGSLFQVRDDILDLFGDKGRGAQGNDLREGKISAVVVGHLEACPEDRQPLLHLLRKERDATTDEDIAFWTQRFKHSGGLQNACDIAAQLADTVSNSPILDAEPTLRELTRRTAATIATPVEALANQ